MRGYVGGSRIFDPSVHCRSIRLPGYDYRQPGAYFVTICTYERRCRLGWVEDGEMVLSASGRVVARCWRDVAVHFAGAALDAFVVMPNHLHGIVILRESGDRGPARVGSVGAKHSRMDAVSPANIDARMLRPYHSGVPSHDVPSDASVAPLRSTPRGTGSGSLSAIVQNFKAVSTRKVNRSNGSPGAALWQRNYYEHVIRDEEDLGRIRAYIESNPAKWELDQLHPDHSAQR